MSGGRLLKRVMFENLDGAVRRKRGGERRVDRFRAGLYLGVWHSGGLESDGVGGRRVG